MRHFQRLLPSSSKEPGCQKASWNQLWSNIQALIREARKAWRELSCRYPWRKLFRPGTFRLPTWCPRAWRWGNQMLAGDLTSHSERALPVPALGLPSHTSPLSSRTAQRGSRHRTRTFPVGSGPNITLNSTGVRETHAQVCPIVVQAPAFPGLCPHQLPSSGDQESPLNVIECPQSSPLFLSLLHPSGTLTGSSLCCFWSNPSKVRGDCGPPTPSQPPLWGLGGPPG